MHVPDQVMFHELMRTALREKGFTIMMNPLGGWGPVHWLTSPKDTSPPQYDGKVCKCPRYLVELMGRNGCVPTCKQKIDDISYMDFKANFKWAAQQLPSGWPMGPGPYKYMLFYGCAVDDQGNAEFDFSCAYSDLNAALAHARRNGTTRYVWDQVEKKAINLHDESTLGGPVMFPQ